MESSHKLIIHTHQFIYNLYHYGLLTQFKLIFISSLLLYQLLCINSRVVLNVFIFFGTSGVLQINYSPRPIQDVHLFFIVCLIQDVQFLYLK